jgi:hypothetical protein
MTIVDRLSPKNYLTTPRWGSQERITDKIAVSPDILEKERHNHAIILPGVNGNLFADSVEENELNLD